MKKRGILAVNLAVLLFGLAGLFAKWIRLPAIAITFGRVLFSSLALGLYLLLRRQSVRVARPGDRLLLAAAGGILALHWWAFLQSIQLSSVAIGTITFSSFPLFVTFLEPSLELPEKVQAAVTEEQLADWREVFDEVKNRSVYHGKALEAESALELDDIKRPQRLEQLLADWKAEYIRCQG